MPTAANRKSKSSRFPVARIKKIMQLDEEVGKLASVTPVMISKSLECFMQTLIDETTQETRSKGSKKLTAQHLKSTIQKQPNFDFLIPIVENVPDAIAGPSTSAARPSDPDVPGGSKSKSSGKRKKVKDEDGNGEYQFGGTFGGGTSSRGKSGRVKQELNTGGRGGVEDDESGAPPMGLPQIGTWKRDMEGGGGTGEGGRGMFDDYEEDDDDY